MRLALIDYGAGNLASVRKGLMAAGAEIVTPREPAGLVEAAGVVVPGVGHFGATAALDEAWRTAIRERLDAGCPLLGICLGMQWLFEGSDEAPDLPGLGVLPGKCWLLSGDPSIEENVVTPTSHLKVPHVGWNTLHPVRPSPLLEGVPGTAYVYFTHSYAAPVTAATVAITRHAEPFASIVEHGLAFGVQFHPEKSGGAGVQMLRNFVGIVSRTAEERQAVGNSR
jgi:imidazole glycerol-phosphate synthase subunit HisH